MESRKPSIVSVSHHSHHNQSIIHKHKYPSLKKKRLNNIIHITIGLSKKIQLNSRNLSSSHENSKKSDYSMKKSSLSKSSRVTPHGTISLFSNMKLNNNDELDRIGIIQDYHQQSKRNKRKKCSRQYIIASMIITLPVILIIATILLVLLIKSPAKRVTRNNTPVLRWNSSGITVAGIGGSPGPANNQLSFPFDIFLDYANNLYIAERGNHRIQKFLRY